MRKQAQRENERQGHINTQTYTHTHTYSLGKYILLKVETENLNQLYHPLQYRFNFRELIL